MNHTLHLPLITNAITTADALGSSIPKALRTEHERLVTLAAKVRTLDLPNDLGSAVLDALERDVDPTTDPAVQQAVTARTLNDAPGSMRAALDVRTFAFLEKHAETLLTSLSKPFDTAAKTLREAHQDLGDLALSDTAAVVAKGGDAASVWAEAQNADKAIADIARLWKLIGTVAGATGYNSSYRILVIADVPPAEFLSQGLRNQNLSAWDVLRAGYTLSLATPQTLRDRIAAVTAEVMRRQQPDLAAAREERRRTHGITVAK